MCIHVGRRRPIALAIVAASTYGPPAIQTSRIVQSTCGVGVLCRNGFVWEPSASALALALQQLKFSKRCSSAGRNRMHAQAQGDLDIKSSSRAAFLGRFPSDVGRAGITRARRRDHLAKFGGRRGVRRRAGTQSRVARGHERRGRGRAVLTPESCLLS